MVSVQSLFHPQGKGFPKGPSTRSQTDRANELWKIFALLSVGLILASIVVWFFSLFPSG